MSSFKVGDRVCVMKDFFRAQTDMAGTIKTISARDPYKGDIGIEFDEKFVGGHTLGNADDHTVHCRDGYGYWVPSLGGYLKIVETCTPLDIDSLLFEGVGNG